MLEALIIYLLIGFIVMGSLAINTYKIFPNAPFHFNRFMVAVIFWPFAVVLIVVLSLIMKKAIQKK